MIGHNGHILLFSGCFTSLWGCLLSFTSLLGAVSVLNFYFGGCILQCFDALSGNCCDWYDWFYMSYLDLMLVYVICGYLIFYSKTVTTVKISFAGCTEVYNLTL